MEVVVGKSEHTYPDGVWGGGRVCSVGLSPRGQADSPGREGKDTEGEGLTCRGPGTEERGRAVRELGALGMPWPCVWEEEAAGEAGVTRSEQAGPGMPGAGFIF